jgi:hypothetical protein
MMTKIASPFAALALLLTAGCSSVEKPGAASIAGMSPVGSVQMT